MKESYLVIGTESEKIRGIVSLDIDINQNMIDRQKESLARVILTGLINTDQSEPLVFEQIEKL